MAFGLRPTKKRGENYNSKGFSTYPVKNGYATALFRGDPVKVSAGYLERATNGDKVVGVFWGASYLRQGDSQPIIGTHLPAGTSLVDTPIDAFAGGKNAVAYVMDDAREVMEIQADSSVSAGHFNKNFQVSIGTGSTFAGLSGANLKVASALTSAGTTTTNFTMVRLVGLKDMPGNTIDSANPVVEVIWVKHQDFNTDTQ
jgi:hypothetical protein